MRAHLIVNPAAGQGDQVERVLALARQAQPGIQVHHTAQAGDAAAFAKRAVRVGAELLVVVGGDGTISEAVNGLAPDFAAVPVLILPLGTGNDFARTLGLPDEPAAVLRLIEQGREQRIDLIEVLGDPPRHLLNAATGGFSELVHERLDPAMKKQWGALAYLRAAVGSMPAIVEHDTRITLDGHTVQSQAIAVIIANGRYAGGGIQLAPEADPSDRRLDVLIVTGRTFLDRLTVASQLLVGTHLQAEDVLFRRAREIHVDATPAMGFSSDGDLLTRTPVTFRILPAALRVLVPMEPARTSA